MGEKGGEVSTYSFTCPLPCNRAFKAVANDPLEAAKKIIQEGAFGCRHSDHRRRCTGVHPDLTPIPEEQLKRIVSLCLREE
jgi:hypothetical protein